MLHNYILCSHINLNFNNQQKVQKVVFVKTNYPYHCGIMADGTDIGDENEMLNVVMIWWLTNDDKAGISQKWLKISSPSHLLLLHTAQHYQKGKYYLKRAIKELHASWNMLHKTCMASTVVCCNSAVLDFDCNDDVDDPTCFVWIFVDTWKMSINIVDPDKVKY